MTVLFSLTSRGLRPRQRTTTLILVSRPASGAGVSKSRSLRLLPAVMPVPVLVPEARDSAGDTAPKRPERDAAACLAAAVCRMACCLMLVRLAAPDRTLELLMVDRFSSRSERVDRWNATVTVCCIIESRPEEVSVRAHEQGCMEYVWRGNVAWRKGREGACREVMRVVGPRVNNGRQLQKHAVAVATRPSSTRHQLFTATTPPCNSSTFQSPLTSRVPLSSSFLLTKPTARTQR